MTREEQEKYAAEMSELSNKFIGKFNQLIADFQRAEKCEVHISMSLSASATPNMPIVSQGLKIDAIPEDYVQKLRQEEYERTDPKIITPNGLPKNVS
ncbi:MAG: hypothetical protein KGH93_03285 [Patescibacteria group bacterium]|nr:hypothetical protein [Patescibacteria group bacterium]